MRVPFSQLVLISGVLFATGCPRSQPPPPPPVDAGMMLPDANLFNYVDTDEDGVCDRTEEMRGMDPTVTDTDGDGLSDRAEIDLGYVPTRTDSPDRASLVILDETQFSMASAPILYTTPRSTAGRSFVGAFNAITVVDPFDVTARYFFEDAIAVGADPMANVFEVRPTEQRFLGVEGATQLLFQANFAFGENATRECARAYPWRYTIKRDDGTIVAAPRFLLIILPAGERIETAAWCLPEGRCI